MTYTIKDKPITIPISTNAKKFNAQVSITLKNDWPIKFQIIDSKNPSSVPASGWNYLTKQGEQQGRLITQNTCSSCQLIIDRVSSLSEPIVVVDVQIQDIDSDFANSSTFIVIVLLVILFGFPLISLFL